MLGRQLDHNDASQQTQSRFAQMISNYASPEISHGGAIDYAEWRDRVDAMSAYLTAGEGQPYYVVL